MCITLSGIVTPVSLLQPLNAESPMHVTVLLPMDAGIVMLPFAGDTPVIVASPLFTEYDQVKPFASVQLSAAARCGATASARMAAALARRLTGEPACS